MNNRSKRVQQNNKIKDIAVIRPDIHYDNRGENVETFCAKYYKMLLSTHEDFRDRCDDKGKEFIVDSVSFSRKNTLRGLHGDDKTYKLIQCLKGSIYVVILDLRKDSPTYKQHDKFYINDKNRDQILIPPGCVNGHLCLSNECIFHYKLTEEYVSIQEQISVKWNDPEYNIPWPVSEPNLIFSDRDR